MTQDYVEMVFPSGPTFRGTGNLGFVENFEPVWLVDGARQLIAVADQLPGIDASPKGQVFFGAGAGIRSFTVSFHQWEGSTDEWGGLSADASVVAKSQRLGSVLADTRVDSASPVTLSYGEYSSTGAFDPLSVVPGPVTLPTDVGESPSSFRPEINWIEAASLDQIIHDDPDA